jgi:hypothetical protein
MYFSAGIFFQFLVIRTLDLDLMNADPQPWHNHYTRQFELSVYLTGKSCV